MPADVGELELEAVRELAEAQLVAQRVRLCCLIVVTCERKVTRIIALPFLAFISGADTEPSVGILAVQVLVT